MKHPSAPRAARLRQTLGCGAAFMAPCLLAALPAHASVNSYRFLHVTIDTPWHIFLFLLMGIFAPFVLMVVLMWRNSGRKRELALDLARKRAGEATRSAPAQPPPPPPA